MAGEAIAALKADKRDSDELRAKWQELEDQLQTLKGSDIPKDEGVQELQKEDRQGGEVHNDLQSSENGNAGPDALERLRGSKDSFAMQDETLKNDEDKASEWEVQRLKNEVKSLELQAKRNEDPERAKVLEEQIREAKDQLRVKGSDVYRRLYAQYVSLFGAAT